MSPPGWLRVISCSLLLVDTELPEQWLFMTVFCLTGWIARVNDRGDVQTTPCLTGRLAQVSARRQIAHAFVLLQGRLEAGFKAALKDARARHLSLTRPTLLRRRLIIESSALVCVTEMCAPGESAQLIWGVHLGAAAWQ